MIDLFMGLKLGDITDTQLQSIHADYAKYSEAWEKCRDTAAGAIEVKSKTTRYLPKLGEKQPDEVYKQQYLNPARWLPAVGSTKESFVGLTMRKDPVYTVDTETEDQKEFLLDMAQNKVTEDGQSSNQVLRTLLEEIWTVNRVGVLEEFPTVDMDLMSWAEFRKRQLKWQSMIYKAENIINWHFEVVDGEKIPVLWVLREEVNSGQVFSANHEIQYRVLLLEPEESTQNGRKYVQLVFKEDEKTKGSDTKKFVLEERHEPVSNGQYLEYIPFHILTSKGMIMDKIIDPLLYDLAEINLGHYRNTADYEHELHKVSIKTVIFPGYDEEQGTPVLGESLMIDNPDAKPFILESTSTSPLSEEMTKKEQRMASIGAQMLAQKGRYVEAAETANIHAQGETSKVSEVAKELGDMWGQILTKKLQLSGYSAVILINVNTDYYEERMTPQELEKAVAAVQAGKISQRAFYNYLDSLEFYPKDWTFEKEQEELARDSLGVINLSDEKYMELLDALEETQKRLEKLENVRLKFKVKTEANNESADGNEEPTEESEEV